MFLFIEFGVEIPGETVIYLNTSHVFIYHTTH